MSSNWCPINPINDCVLQLIIQFINLWIRYLRWRNSSSEARIRAGWAQAHPKISKTSCISANWWQILKFLSFCPSKNWKIVTYPLLNSWLRHSGIVPDSGVCVHQSCESRTNLYFFNLVLLLIWLNYIKVFVAIFCIEVRFQCLAFALQANN
jgi:hypothetical protein